MDDNRLTIGLLTTGYLHIGGVENHLCQLIQQSPSQYHWLVFGNFSTDLHRRLADAGARIFTWTPRGRFDRKAISELTRILRDEHANLVHAHFPRAGFLGGLAARQTGIPIIITNHGPSYQYPEVISNRLKSFLYRWAERWCYRHLYSRVIYVSRRTFDEACRGGQANLVRATVIANGVDLGQFHHTRRETLRHALNLSSDEKLIIFVGRLSPEKGPDIFLDAMSKLPLSDRRIRIVLAGDGPLREELEKCTAKAGITDRVTFLGFSPEIANLMIAGDLFVLTSRYENHPIALLEALTASLPCVVSDVGDNGLIVRQGIDGHVVQAEDPQAVADACLSIIDDDNLRSAMSRHACERGREYSLDRSIEKILTLYHTVRQEYAGRLRRTG